MLKNWNLSFSWLFINVLIDYEHFSLIFLWLLPRYKIPSKINYLRFLFIKFLFLLILHFLSSENNAVYEIITSDIFEDRKSTFQVRILFWNIAFKKYNKVPLTWGNFWYIFLASGGGFPIYPEILQYYTMILQRPRIIVGDTEFGPGTSAPDEVWRYQWATTSQFLFLIRVMLPLCTV